MHGLTALREGHEDPKRTKFRWLNRNFVNFVPSGSSITPKASRGRGRYGRRWHHFCAFPASRPSGSGSADPAKYDLRNGFRVI
jgi:hypothetical protein